MVVERCFGCMEEQSTYPCSQCGYTPANKPEPYALRPGTILDGKYLVGKMLGQGGFGITYIGWDLQLERKVAIKEYFPAGHVSRETSTGALLWHSSEAAQMALHNGQEMFLKEARKMSKVSEIAQTVRIFSMFQEKETAYICMDFIEGYTLKDRLKKNGLLSWEQVKEIFLPVIAAMEQVHQVGLIHRDISPDNLMLQPNGGVKILDLGAAKDLKLNSGHSSMQVAKSGFSPLEQYIERGKSGPWTDVYALAATMYYSLTGVIPPSAVDRVDRDTLNWDLPQLQEIPAESLAAMKRAMTLRSGDRTQTMAAFSEELMQTTSPAQAEATPPEQEEATPPEQEEATPPEQIQPTPPERTETKPLEQRKAVEKAEPPKPKKKWLLPALAAAALAIAMFVGMGMAPGTQTPAIDTPVADAPMVNAPVAIDAKVSVFWYDESDIYLSSVRGALNKELDALGVAYDNQFAAGDQSKQLDQIKTAVASGTDLLVVNVVTSRDPDTAQTILDAAGDIPVIFFNRAIGTDGSDVTVLSNSTTSCFIGTDTPEAGHMQGKMVGEYVLANYDEIDLNGDGAISYAMFKGQEGNIEAIYRTQYGVEDADAILTAAGKPALVYFNAANTDKYQVDTEGAWSAKAAKEYMDTNLVTYNEANGNMIELVICNNDGMAEGAVASLQRYGYNIGGAHTIPVFGIDGTGNAKVLIADGAMTGTVMPDAEGLASAIAQTVFGIATGFTPVEALAGLSDDRFTIAFDCAAKLSVAYTPYTGE